MTKIEFNAAFRTDKAGRSANQDNGFILLDIKGGDTGSQTLNTDRTAAMGDYGTLMLVADGMGGMNAGEKASELIKETMLREFGKVTAKVPGNAKSMCDFLGKAIQEADLTVKDYARTHASAKGMGSTIVALWIYGDMAAAAWVGDSRIYRYNPAFGLARLSHDHSYVQSLVDTGRLPEHLAFDHPDSNIITRSLGDNGTPANPEMRVYKVYDDDEFLLCSDGLCGLLTDKEIQTIMSEHIGSSKATLEALWAEGEAKGWSDNATIEVLCVSGDLPAAPVGHPDGYPAVNANTVASAPTLRRAPETANNMQPQAVMPQPGALAMMPQPEVPASRKSLPVWTWILICFVIAAGAVWIGFKMFEKKDAKEEAKMERLEEDQDLKDEEFSDPEYERRMDELNEEYDPEMQDAFEDVMNDEHFNRYQKEWESKRHQSAQPTTQPSTRPATSHPTHHSTQPSSQKETPTTGKNNKRPKPAAQPNKKTQPNQSDPKKEDPNNKPGGEIAGPPAPGQTNKAI